MRPRYERPEDLENEKTVRKILMQKWAVEMHKMPMAYHLDWMVTKDSKAVAFAELKCRDNSILQYPTLMLSMHKWMHGRQMAEEIDGSFLVIVKWIDGLYYHRQGTAAVTYGVGGRKDRGDSQDMEPVVHIPTDSFKLLA